MLNFPLLGDFPTASQNAYLNNFRQICSNNSYKNGDKHGS